MIAICSGSGESDTGFDARSTVCSCVRVEARSQFPCDGPQQVLYRRFCTKA
jgi:hypothetical protein